MAEQMEDEAVEGAKESMVDKSGPVENTLSDDDVAEELCLKTNTSLQVQSLWCLHYMSAAGICSCLTDRVRCGCYPASCLNFRQLLKRVCVGRLISARRGSVLALYVARRRNGLLRPVI